MTEITWVKDKDLENEQIIQLENFKIEDDESSQIQSSPIESQDNYEKIIVIMRSHLDKLEDAKDNYGFDNKDIQNMKNLFDGLNY